MTAAKDQTEDIEAALRVFIEPGQITELRVLDASTQGYQAAHTESGYFDDLSKMARAAAGIRQAAGSYFIPNPVNPSLLARAANRVRPVRREPLTGDNDVTARRWLLVDADATRPSGISSTDAEHEAALAKVREIRDALRAEGWPDPALADSGNGGHLLYPVDLQVNDGGLVQRCLEALAFRHNDEKVIIDQTVFNPARIWKLYGTWTCKGDSTADRPHRLARLIEVPEARIPVPKELLEALAASVPRMESTTRTSAAHAVGHQPFNLGHWILEHQLDAAGPTPWRDGQKWVLCVCPWNSEHKNRSAYIVQFANGAIAAGCHHNGCTGKNWHSLRDLVEPGWRERRGASVSFVSSPPGVSPAEWPDPQPLPEELPPVMQFDYELLPAALRPWVQDIVERTQCPPDYVAVGVMVALAGVVGRRIGIRPKRNDDWLVVPNLWGATIGRPGVLKTPALRQSIAPLQRLEIEAKEEFSAKVIEHEAQMMVAEAGRRNCEKEIAKALSNGDDAMAIARAAISEGPPPVIRRRFLVNDSTVEKLGELLNENPTGLTAFRDELIGLLRSLDKEGQEGARAFYLEAWAGDGSFIYDRIGRGTIDIKATTLSIIGSIQPGRLGEYLRGAVRGGADDDGLLQRFQLVVWPDVSGTWRNVDRWPEVPAKNKAYAVYRSLAALDPRAVQAQTDPEPDAIPFLRFTQEGQDLFDAWRARLEQKVRSGEEHPALESHLAKYRSLIPSLALLIHLADSGIGPVAAEPLRRAIRWGEYLESHARRLYSLAVHPDVAAAKALAKRIQAGDVTDGFALRDVYRSGWTGLTEREDAERAASLLLDLDWLRGATEQTPGRDRTRYFINPKIQKRPSHPTDKTDRSPADPLLSVLSVPQGDAPEPGPAQATGSSEREASRD
jgi:putative DNA primase/helicase